MLIAVPLRQNTAPGDQTTGVPILISQHNPVGYFTHEYNWTHISFNISLRHANLGGQWRRTLAFGCGYAVRTLANIEQRVANEKEGQYKPAKIPGSKASKTVGGDSSQTEATATCHAE